MIGEKVTVEKVRVSFKDGSVRFYDKGISLRKIAESVSGRLARESLAVRVNDILLDMSALMSVDGEVDFITLGSEGSYEVLRHSGAHIMAQAVKRLFPEAQYAIGPVIRDGFYYDFEVDKPFTEGDLVKIEEEMRSIVKASDIFVREEKGIDEAISFFRARSDSYKVEILEDLKLRGESVVSIYSQGDFVDLCRGPHIPDTSFLKAFKLMSVAGAYWRGDSSARGLQRIYGTAFFKAKELKEHLLNLEEIKKRDHRRLGKDLDLFSFHSEAPGFPFWHSRGKLLYDSLLSFIRAENLRRGYMEVETPIVLNSSLWHASGHYDNFKENMYFTHIDDREFALKPMNCPAHCLIYKSSLHSYRELPIRISEFGLVHRHELSGVLHGLFRVRNFTQDDAHIYCMEGQIRGEIKELISYTLFVYDKVGFKDYRVYLATRPVSYIGSDEEWELATESLRGALSELDISYGLKEGEGAFYGPKIEFNVEDSLGRDWQCGTIQLDFSMPERLGLSYEGSDGVRHVPVMIHRAILGSLERFIGILIEHYGGHFPLWLAPVQLKLLPIMSRHMDYGLLLRGEFERMGFRVGLDFSDEKLGYKIRKAQLEKVPFMIILGDKELELGKLSVRSRGGGDLGLMGLEELKVLLDGELGV